MDPLVSVIVPTRDRDDLLDRAPSSISEQNYDAIEMIVVDDSTTPLAYGRVRSSVREPSTLRLRRCSQCGSAAAGNVGITAAEGEYLAFLDAELRGGLHASMNLRGRGLCRHVEGTEPDVGEGVAPDFVRDPGVEERLDDQPNEPGRAIELSAAGSRSHQPRRNGWDAWRPSQPSRNTMADYCPRGGEFELLKQLEKAPPTRTGTSVAFPIRGINQRERY